MAQLTQTALVLFGVLPAILMAAAVPGQITAYELNNCALTEVNIPALDISNYTDPGSHAMYNEGLFQGDITGGMGVPANFAKDTETFAGINANAWYDYWPGGVVYYEFHSSVSAADRTLIQNTLSEMTALTRYDCIRFVNRNGCPNIQNYVLVRSDLGGCWSSVGRNKNGFQELSLQANGCMWKRIIMHEFMHALGFFHEQSRPDRDDYVQINWENINCCQWNFDKVEDSNTFGTSYDIRSLMHYEYWGFAKPGTSTMTPIGIYAGLDVSEMGSRQNLGPEDLKLIGNAYSCF